MQIGEVIRRHRKEMNMTQEEMAERLGVTAPAVCKWESSQAYPDITLLVPLARLLSVDLNSLLSFEEKPDEKEIDGLVQEISRMAVQQGFEQAFCEAGRKIKEYPSCYELILGLASALQGLMLFVPEGVEDGERYEKEICGWYERVAAHADSYLSKKACEQLFYQYINNGNLAKAEEILQKMPQEEEEAKQAKISLYMKQGNFTEARLLLENRLLTAAGHIQQALGALTVIALKEDDLENARFLADTLSESVKTLQLWEYGSFSAYLEVYCKEKDIEGLIRIFKGMLESVDKPWKLGETTLYRHIPQREQGGFLPGLLKKDLLDMLLHEEKLAFFRESEEGSAFLKTIQA